MPIQNSTKQSLDNNACTVHYLPSMGSMIQVGRLGNAETPSPAEEASSPMKAWSENAALRPFIKWFSTRVSRETNHR